jgi:alginate O-acetyltransferase complex protein AlgI
MVYSSLPFLFVFLPCLLLVYFAGGDRLRNIVLVAASLFFYAWGGWDFFGILVAFIISHWAGGLLIHACMRKDRPGLARVVVTGFIAGDIALIAWFKYANFAVKEINWLTDLLGGTAPFAHWSHIMLPIGISFFTFQGMSYIFDVARGTVRPLRNPLDFALYEGFFPQLIAGPIVRYAEIENQIEHRSISLDDFSAGLMRFCHGVGKKVLIADPVSLWADAAFADPSLISTTEAWVGLLAYTIQIYFDFSGYSDMAIGLGRMFGFTFPENFNRPMSASSVTEFWRRWHMTLTRWFRDYLYIPLGGSREGTTRTYRNLFIVFLATGIWHGANWTFLLWGLWHGIWLIFERWGRRNGDPAGSPLIGRIRTLLVVMLGWALFRADTIFEAGDYFAALFGFGASLLGTSLVVDFAWWLPLAALGVGIWTLAAPITTPVGVRLGLIETYRARPVLSVYCVAVLALSVVELTSGSASPFLYFRF